MSQDNHPNLSHPDAHNQRPSDFSAEHRQVEAILRQGSIRDLAGMMRWGSNYAALITVEHEDACIDAVYKPQRGERPLWDFPMGTLCFREYLAYVISEEIGWHLVPPTVLRDGPYGLGSLQRFIPHDPEIHYFTLDDSFGPELQKYALFDIITNNADRKGGHVLLGENGKLWGIDHGLTFNPIPKLRTVIWDFAGEPIPTDLLNDVATLYRKLQDTTRTVYQQINEFLEPNEIQALLTRIQHLMDRQVYPHPGAGPSFPWPPV